MHTIYLIPGLGADHRLFKGIRIEGYRMQILEKELPDKGSSMGSYARKLAQQIDTTQPFSIIGVSIGGMLAVEMSKFLQPQKLIIIASAKTKNELPAHFRLLRKMPLHLVVHGSIIKRIGNLSRPIFGPAEKEDNAIFSAMLNEQHPLFMQRAIDCIIQWENTTYRSDIIHIHGDADRTLPYKKIKKAVRIEGGSHLMTLTKAKELNELLNQLFNGTETTI